MEKHAAVEKSGRWNLGGIGAVLLGAASLLAFENGAFADAGIVLGMASVAIGVAIFGSGAVVRVFGFSPKGK